MLLGNIGIVASAGSLILGFGGHSAGGNGTQVVELVVGLLAIVFVSRSAVVDRWLTAAAGRFLGRRGDLPQRDLAACCSSAARTR